MRPGLVLPFVADIFMATRIAKDNDPSANLLMVNVQGLPSAVDNAQALGKKAATYQVDSGTLILSSYGSGSWGNPIKGPMRLGLATFDIQTVKLSPDEALEKIREKGELTVFRSL